MHRIDTDGATAGHKFKDGPAPATVVDAAWLNAVQEAVAKVIESAGITLTKGDDNQLYNAIVGLVAAGAFIKKAVTNDAMAPTVLASTVVSDDVFSAPIQIREVNYVGNAQSGGAYGPALSFHWFNTAASAIKMDNAGNFHLRAPGGAYRSVRANSFVFADGTNAPKETDVIKKAVTNDAAAPTILASTVVSDDVFNSPIQIREVNYVGNAQSATSYGPALTFHWFNKAGSAIKMDASGSFHLRAQNGGYRDVSANAFISTGGKVARDGSFYMDLFGSLAQLVMGSGCQINHDRANQIVNVTVQSVAAVEIVAGGVIIGENLLLKRKNSGKYIHFADGAISGDSITRGVTGPSGGADGDIHLQYNSSAGTMTFWHNFGGVWCHT